MKNRMIQKSLVCRPQVKKSIKNFVFRGDYGAFTNLDSVPTYV